VVIRKITPEDAEYPKNLRNIHSAPKQLYVKGALLDSDETAVAIIGSRRASMYGIETAERLGYELAVRGVTVVSGMARGIDSASHRGALRAKGRTIAVMGSGHGVIYPPENKKLYEEIAKSGAVVTEFDFDTEPLPRNFPARNRIISGLSLGVVVVEAARNSGALITSDFAAEQGRTVFAVPGRVSSGTSGGANGLIKDGACLVQSVDDIIDELNLVEMRPVERGRRETTGDKISKKTKAYIYNSLTDDERKVYKILSDEPVHTDDLSENTKLGAAKLSKVLVDLELKRLIKALPGKQYVRKEN
jgi:DNA processing protein